MKSKRTSKRNPALLALLIGIEWTCRANEFAQMTQTMSQTIAFLSIRRLVLNLLLFIPVREKQFVRSMFFGCCIRNAMFWSYLIVGKVLRQLVEMH